MKPSEIGVIYMGTPEFAVPALEALHKEGYRILAVVTQPDKARDRGKQVQFPPVKEKALELGIPVLQPERIQGNQEFTAALQGYAPDLMVVAAYGKLLPEEILSLPKFGCINIHGSLLPKYRGAAPIQRSIQAGDPVTGVTLMQMAMELDAGDMLASAETSTAGKTSSQLYEELAVLGADLLIRTIPDILNGSITPIPQDPDCVTLAPMICKEDGHLDFKKSAGVLDCQVRAMDSWPCAYASYEGIPFKIREAVVLSENTGQAPGTITQVSAEGIQVSCGEGSLLIKSLQFPNKKTMPVSEFIKGNRIKPGTVLK